jgi:hypothetical protein
VVGEGKASTCGQDVISGLYLTGGAEKMVEWRCPRCAAVISADDTVHLVRARQWDQVLTAGRAVLRQLAVERTISAQPHERPPSGTDELLVGVCLSESNS